MTEDVASSTLSDLPPSSRPPEALSLAQFVAGATGEGTVSTEDLLAACMPLLRQVAEVHARGMVAPLEGIDALRVTAGTLWFENAKALPPRTNPSAIERVQQADVSGALEVVAHYRSTEEDGGVRIDDLRILERGQPLVRPAYVPGYASWEHEVAHHDPLTDVFVLGLVLASVATGIDLSTTEGLARFVANRQDLRRLNQRLHPVAALVIARMTELDRHRRLPELTEAIVALERRRHQDALAVFDLAKFRSFVASHEPDRRESILTQLQSRLYERSRRNRLLYFRATAGTLNLTASSVPLVLDVKSVDADALATWSGTFAADVLAQKPVVLSRWLRVEDYPFIVPALDRIRLDAARDAAEYGFSQLRLVVCFLHWHDLKNAPEERVSSPLLLLPVRLVKRKGVRDAYTLEATADLAEVNPVLRHHLRQLYGLALPESVDLTKKGAIDELHQALVEQITATERAVVLEKVERPRIDLVQAIARRRLDAHRRHARLTGRGVRSLHGFDYSYSRERRIPLGIQLFQHVVHPSPAPQRELLERPRPRIFRLGPEGDTVKQVEKHQFHLHDAAEGSPHRWALDLVSVTLANFNYRKMSLVGDYTAMLREQRPSKTFDALFPVEARPPKPDAPALRDDDRYDVVDGDPTQARAIALARAGASFVIQGPPGTGKSQTIVNLVADFLACGKRVLFVCEKRAAIDVVHHRLQQQGIGRLCSVIHDSQSDKKSFVLALKDAYEGWLQGTPDPAPAEERRVSIRKYVEQREELGRFVAEMTAPASGSDEPLVRVMRRSIELGDVPVLDEATLQRIPEHRLFEAHATSVRRIADDLRRIGAAPVLARHPARLLRCGPDGTIPAQLRERLHEVRARVAALVGDDGERAAPLVAVADQAYLARLVLPLARARLLSLLASGSELYRRLRSAALELKQRLDALSKAEADASGWRSPLDREDARSALELAKRFQASLLRFFYPSFWRLRQLLRERFDFATRAVRPTFVQVLERLVARHSAESAVDEQRKLLARESGVDDVQPLLALADRVQSDPLTPHQAGLREALAAERVAPPRVEALARLADACDDIDALLAGWRLFTPKELITELDRLDAGYARLPEALPVLRAAEALPSPLAVALRTIDLEVDGLEAAVCDKAVRGSSGARTGALDGAGLESAHETLVHRHQAMRRANGAHIVEKVRARFLEHVRVSSAPAASLGADEKALKKQYATGRRELEHEFGKVMRFRPIRELLTGAPGEVVRDLKPVWLMSPLSVADTLPLSADFDVVLVDEASQIPLEDAIPALERGRQIIIVGDDKQLPPTSFFSARSDEEEDDESSADEAGARLQADSLLEHSARALPSTMLGWHYRSRDESLISFCNQAFYDGRLLTVPSQRRAGARGEILGRGAADGEAAARALLDRPLSFHRMQDAIYEDRRNGAEAAYIAGMVRELLRAETGLTFGVVAFSEAQQGEIEDALRRLADEDADFRARYDAEAERVEDGQFVGLFVKNLENVQGDERDVIILSICYGPDASGRMLMNFGPVNQRGGERRLNVVFSRAKRHMAVVSSIDWTRITNDYNDGAACLKNYLRYAAAASRGDDGEAALVLDSLARAQGAATRERAQDPVARRIAAALVARGWDAELDVGASSFRCDVAVRKPGERVFRLGALVDTERHYENEDLDDRFRLKPAVLRSFGWRIAWVLARDWLLSRDAVLARIETLLQAAGESASPVKAQTLGSAPAS